MLLSPAGGGTDAGRGSEWRAKEMESAVIRSRGKRMTGGTRSEEGEREEKDEAGRKGRGEKKKKKKTRAGVLPGRAHGGSILSTRQREGQ